MEKIVFRGRKSYFDFVLVKYVRFSCEEPVNRNLTICLAMKAVGNRR